MTIIEIWNYKVKKQNILYTTTSNDYGYNKPSIEEMPKQYFSTNHEFTRVYVLLKKFFYYFKIIFN